MVCFFVPLWYTFLFGLFLLFNGFCFCFFFKFFVSSKVMSEINIICFVYRPIVLMLQSLNCPPDLPSTNRYANKLGFFYGCKLIFQHFNKIYSILNFIQ